MAQFAVFKEKVVYPLAHFGLTDPLWGVNLETVISSWCVLIALVILVLITHVVHKQKNNIFAYLLLLFTKMFKDLVDQTLGAFHFRHFTFIATLFLYILVSNTIALIPGIEEPTNDVTTTLALGITAFLYTQISSIEANGIKEYCKSYLEPFFLMLPLNIVSNVATVISISFRLFGNIFGGSVISGLWYSLIGGNFILELTGIGMNLLIVCFFVLFEGFIQAFVFSMLSLTYLSLEVRHEEVDSSQRQEEAHHV